MKMLISNFSKITVAIVCVYGDYDACLRNTFPFYGNSGPSAGLPPGTDEAGKKRGKL